MTTDTTQGAEGASFYCETCNTEYLADAKLSPGERVEDDEPGTGRRRVRLSPQSQAQEHVCPGKK